MNYTRSAAGPNEIEMIFRGNAPVRDFVRVAQLTAGRSDYQGNEELFQVIRREAARSGLDGVVDLQCAPGYSYALSVRRHWLRLPSIPMGFEVAPLQSEMSGNPRLACLNPLSLNRLSTYRSSPPQRDYPPGQGRAGPLSHWLVSKEGNAHRRSLGSRWPKCSLSIAARNRGCTAVRGTDWIS